MLPTFDTYFDDDPRLDTSGRSETPVDTPDEGPGPSAGPDTALAAEMTEETPDMAPERAPEGPASVADRPDADDAQGAGPETPDTPDTLETPDTAADNAGYEPDPFIPKVNEDYFNLPSGAPIRESFEDRRVDVMDPDGILNSVTQITDEEAFRREAEAHLAVNQDKGGADYPDWIRKPDPWPAFISFPTHRDLKAIQIAEEKGKLDDERKEKFNEHFERLSILMQERARQMDAWIMSENEEILKQERNRAFIFRSYVKKDIQKLRKGRAKAAVETSDAPGQDRGAQDPASLDPFYDVKWAILLDPYASPDDPRFAEVARWGHGTVTMLDGGSLRVNNDGIRVPPGDDGSEMAGKLAVLEAIERGWTSIDISGSEEFVKGAREAAIKAGLGAKITTRYGLLGKSRTEFIMPKPPKLDGVETPSDDARAAHDDLLAGNGQAPDGAPEAAGGRSLAEPGATGETVPEAAQIDDPFDDDAPEDDAALARMRADEAETPSPSPA